MSQGYVYVLINPSMPGLLKIGKTSRDVEQRAKELSSNTGVPAEFIVIFKQAFIDADVAESQIHTFLENNGHRHNKNREFFQIDSTKAINYILSLDGKIDNLLYEDEDSIPTTQNASNWLLIFEKANDYYYGNDGFKKDLQKAEELFIQASSFGCPLSYNFLGDICLKNKNKISDYYNKTISYYDKGVKKGDYYCNLSLLKLYAAENDDAKLTELFGKFVYSYNKNQNDIIEEYNDFGTSVIESLTILFSKNIFEFTEDNIVFLIKNYSSLRSRIEKYKRDLVENEKLTKVEKDRISDSFTHLENILIKIKKELV